LDTTVPDVKNKKLELDRLWTGSELLAGLIPV